MGSEAIVVSGEEMEPPAGTAKGIGAEPLTGNKRIIMDLLERDSERPVMKDQETRPELTDDKVHQEIAIIPEDY